MRGVTPVAPENAKPWHRWLVIGFAAVTIGVVVIPLMVKYLL